MTAQKGIIPLAIYPPWVQAQRNGFARVDRKALTPKAIERDNAKHKAAGASKVVRDSWGYPIFVVHMGTAIIDICGPMSKSTWWGCDTVLVRSAIRAAIQDQDVGAILLRIDSPGGDVAGTMELADEVRAADKAKPVYAYCEDMGASAAFWVAAQAREVFCNEMALVGSIGTYAVLYDESQLAEKLGIKVIVLSTGALKGAGIPGTEIGQEFMDYFQGIVEAFNERFLRAISIGRMMAPKSVRELATGAVWIGPDARKRGLVDEVLTFEQALTRTAVHLSPALRLAGARATFAKMSEDENRERRLRMADAELRSLDLGLARRNEKGKKQMRAAEAELRLLEL